MSRPLQVDEAKVAAQLHAIFAGGHPYGMDKEQRESELQRTVQELRCDDSPDVWNHSRPLEQYRPAADKLAKEIAESLTKDMARTNASSDQQMRARRFGNWLEFVRTGERDERRGYKPLRDFFNYCADLIGTALRGDYATSLAEAENRRLIIPFEASGSAPGGADDRSMPDIALYTQGVGAQAEHQNNLHYAATSHIIECKWHPNDFPAALLQLSGYILHMFENQHDLRYAIGMTICGTVVKIVIFAHDSILVSTDANIATPDGRKAFIRQIVDWSICSRDKLGLDTTIQRYVLPTTPLTIRYQIDINRTHYYGKTCIQAADTLAGRRRRCLLLSANADDLDNATHMLINEWPLATKRQRHDTGDEAKLLERFRVTFANDDDLQDKYPQLVRAERVRQKQGEEIFTEDNTEKAYGALHKIRPRAALADDDWGTSHFRAHKHTLIEFPGTAISEANNALHVVIAIAHAMTTHNSIYTQLGIVHSEIRAANILHRIVEGGVLGVLAGFSNAIDIRAENQQLARPELAAISVLLPIRILEDPAAIRTPLDDWESLLYLVCWLGMFGINRAERMAYVADYTPRYHEGGIGQPPILEWAHANAEVCARSKRNHLSTLDSFDDNILSHMRDTNGPLCHLAEDIYRALFLHAGCSGTCLTSNRQPRHPGAPVVAPAPGVIRDPLILRINHMVVILQNLLDVMAMHRDAALAALEAAQEAEGGGA